MHGHYCHPRRLRAPCGERTPRASRFRGGYHDPSSDIRLRGPGRHRGRPLPARRRESVPPSPCERAREPGSPPVGVLGSGRDASVAIALSASRATSARILAANVDRYPSLRSIRPSWTKRPTSSAIRVSTGRAAVHRPKAVLSSSWPDIAVTGTRHRRTAIVVRIVIQTPGSEDGVITVQLISPPSRTSRLSASPADGACERQRTHIGASRRRHPVGQAANCQTYQAPPDCSGGPHIGTHPPQQQAGCGACSEAQSGTLRGCSDGRADERGRRDVGPILLPYELLQRQAPDCTDGRSHAGVLEAIIQIELVSGTDDGSGGEPDCPTGHTAASDRIKGSVADLHASQQAEHAARRRPQAQRRRVSRRSISRSSERMRVRV